MTTETPAAVLRAVMEDLADRADTYDGTNGQPMPNDAMLMQGVYGARAAAALAAPANTCLITSCVFLRHGMWAAGDLHWAGGSYVFVANVDHTKGGLVADWWSSEPPTTLRVSPTQFFERRGVFVFEQREEWLSEAAIAHIRRWA